MVIRTLFRRNLLLLGFAIACLLAVMAAAVNQLYATVRFMDRLSESHARSNAFRQFLRILNEAEAAERGYIITLDPQYLEGFPEDPEIIDKELLKLRELAKDSRRQLRRIDRIESIATEKFAVMREAIEVRRTEGFERARDLISRKSVRVALDQIREVLYEGIQEEESSVQGGLRFRQTRGLWVTTFLMIVGTGLCVAAALNAWVLFRKAVRSSVAQRRMILQRKRALHADREKTRFMANMSHEIRTPMNAILGFIQLLSDENLTPRGRQYVKAIETAGENLLALINDVLDVSRIEAGRVELRLETADLRELVSGLWTLVALPAQEKGVSLETGVDDDVPAWVRIDVLRVRQILLNLLTNAVKFTDRGRVTLRVSAIRSAEEPERVTLRAVVEDTGRGISPGDLERIFQPFRQGRHAQGNERGTGLGLAITRQLTEIMGGRVEAESTPGKGSRFTITLPDVEVPAASSTVSATIPQETLADLPPLNVLIVDDNPYNREVMGGFFRRTHHTVRYALDGREALEAAAKQRPDVILMDIRMPRMDGRTARRELMRNPEMKGTAIIAVTASTLQESASRRDGFDACLRKPFLRNDLCQAVRRALEIRRPGLLPEPPPEPPSGGPEPAPPEVRDPEGLLRTLEAWRESRWPELARSMPVREVTEFAADLEDLANRHASAKLAVYAATLYRQASTFRALEAEETLTAFPELVDSLKADVS